jgi:hypothetical protein
MNLASPDELWLHVEADYFATREKGERTKNAKKLILFIALATLSAAKSVSFVFI